MHSLKTPFTWLTGLLVVILSAVLPIASRAQTTISDKLISIGGYDCPNSRFTCVKLTVPLDHTNPGDKRTLDVVFGVLPATGERKGMFVTATGGPGSSGLDLADSYAGAFDSAILEQYDLVFFDQRGARQSGNLECPDALNRNGFGDPDAIINLPQDSYAAQAQNFVNDCVTELASKGIPEDTLKFYATSQAVEDLDYFREQIGDEKIWLYGESYGTEFAQRYALAHPDHVAALFLDGAVDIMTPLLDFQAEQAQAFNDVLIATLHDCNLNALCAADAGGDALALYDGLAAELGRNGIRFDFPAASGRVETRTMTLDMLESAAGDALYSQEGRMMFQRALTAVAQGNFVPLARLYYASIGSAAENRMSGLGDPLSDTLYYVIACADNRIAEGTPEAQVTAYLQAGSAVEASIPRLYGSFYGRLPCAYWPENTTYSPPQALEAQGFPTFVMGATTDPATPIQNGERVFSRLDDGYLITAEGGAHVIFNRFNSCPDDLIRDFLVNDVRPTERSISCEDVIADPYIPLSPTSVRVFDTPLQIMDAVYNEIYYLPEYFYWDSNQLILTACSTGGVLAVAADKNFGDQFRLSDCSFFNGFVMSGSGSYDRGTFTLEVDIGGYESGSLTYIHEGDGTIHVTGEYAGQTVDLSDTRPDSAN